MLEFLVHKCIKDADEIERPEVRKRYGFFSSIVGIICNVILFASKLAIGLIAGSISIVSDGVNNLSDCATCIRWQRSQPTGIIRLDMGGWNI